MLHQHYTEYLRTELDFLKLLIVKFHEKEKISDIELDLALGKTQDIYEQLLKLKLIHRQLREAKPSRRQVVELVSEPMPETIVPVEPEPAPEALPEPSPEPAPAPKPQSKQAARQKTNATKVNTLADTFRPAATMPINETLAQKKPVSDLSSKLQAAHLNSIAAGIGLNDRFLFIRELFGGNADQYATTITALDNAPSLEAALRMIAASGWDMESETVQKFVQLVHRKHS